MNSKDDLVVVAGPTASGKTEFAINIAKKINGVIINADSMQVYRGMDIGTNKGIITKVPNSEFRILKDNGKNGDYLINAFDIENSGVLGYLFNIVEPDEDFSVAYYQKLTNELIEMVREDGKIPILVGGSGLYVDSILKNYSLTQVSKNNLLRDDLSVLSIEQLYDELYKISPRVAIGLNESDKFNKRRLIRRIELANEGMFSKTRNNLIPHIMYYPKFDREVLYQKINNRVEEMIDLGFVEEVKSLVEKGYKDCKSMQGMGYKEMVDYLEGDISIDEAISKMKQAHRNYASRQITWFENDRRGYNLVKVKFDG